MVLMKLFQLTLLFLAALQFVAAEEACDVSATDSGRAMMQVSGGPVTEHLPKRSVSTNSHANQHMEEQNPKDIAVANSSANFELDEAAMRMCTIVQAKKLSKIRALKSQTPDATNVPLNEGGYKSIANLCCNYEMEELIRRIVGDLGLKVCDEGGLQGLVPFHVCNKAQSYVILREEIEKSAFGTCPWTAEFYAKCKTLSQTCRSGKPIDPMSHRRRNCCRNDNTDNMDLGMTNAQTNEFVESICGSHQQFMDVKSPSGVLRECTETGDATHNNTKRKACLDECCIDNDCIGITVQKDGTTLQKSFNSALTSARAISYLHRQR